MQNKAKKQILDVVPLTKIPLTRNQSFWYLSDQKAVPGSLISIPLFHRQLEGIVLDSRQDFKRLGNIILKKIDQVIEENFLTPQQLELAQFISDYYISPLGIVMKNFVPKRVVARNKKTADIKLGPSPVLRTSSPEGRGGIILTKEQLLAVNEITKKINWKLEIGNWKFLLYGPSSSGKTEVYIHSILKLKKENNKLQFLILIPEKTLAPQAFERYGAYFKNEEIAVLSSNISKGQYYSSWKKIRSGEAKIIIGTRMSVFAPFKKLGLIIIDEEQDMSFKQWDMNPRYDARIVAEKLAEVFKCPIVRGSATPTIESYYKASNKKYKLLKLPELEINNENPKSEIRNPKQIQNSKIQISKELQSTKYKLPATIIVDMKKERWEKNTSCISKKLKSEIAYALKYGLQAILFVNRQGMSAFSVCEACRVILKCPKCDRALIYENAGIYKCTHCTYKTSPVPQCPKCKGISFKNIGIGTQKVERELKTFFPEVTILRADKETSRKASSQEKIYSDFSQKKASILVGTQMISKGWDLRNVALIGIIDTDNMFSIPDFGTSEKAYQDIVQVSGRTSRIGANYPGVIVIQTFHPENKNIQLIARKDFENFYKYELAERKSLELPPFGKLIKLIFQDYSLKRALTETERVYKMLDNITAIRATEPQDAFIPKIRGRFRRQIIIKYKKEIPASLRKELNKLGSSWIIDVEPISAL